MSSTHTQSQLCTTNRISSFVLRSYFISVIAFVSCQFNFNRMIYQVTGLNISTGHQTISELCPTKSDVKLKIFFISYRRLKLRSIR